MPRFVHGLILALLGACGFQGQAIGVDGHVPVADGHPDAPGQVADGNAMSDGNASCTPWIAANVDPCDPALGTPMALALVGGAFKLDTDTGELANSQGDVPVVSALVAQAGGPSVRVVNATTFDLASDATLTVRGTHPLVIVVHEIATIAGAIDASAADDAAGPGGEDVTQCAMGTGTVGMPATGAAAGGGGAGGGAFGGKGGDGADGNGGAHGAHGAGGAVNGTMMLVPLRGGCAGGSGGMDVGGNAGGAAGRAGGALEITARMSITVAGTVAAAGGGGRAEGQSKTGGGGGGAGGAILLDGDAITISGALCANGGAGGEGGQTGQPALDGQPGTCSDTVLATDAGVTDGGDGGNGTVVGHPDGTGGKTGMTMAGGGSGGGGIGAIRTHARTGMPTIAIGAHISPMAAP